MIAPITLNALPAPDRISFPPTSGMVCDGRRPDSSLHLFFFVQREDGSGGSRWGDVACAATAGGEAGVVVVVG